MTNAARDRGIAAGLFAGTLIYLWFWPRDLNGFDESLYLYEAKRISAGAVMYRDFFQVVTPAWFYMMAALFALFGVSLEVARAAMSVTHGFIGALIFVLSRRVGVRPIVALLLAMTHLMLGYPTCPIATPHWFSTFLTLVLLLVVLRWPATTATRAVCWGVLAGVLTLVQQQKGLVMIAGVGVILLLDVRQAGSEARWTAAFRRALAYAAGIAMVVVPVMIALVVAAGFDELWRALVRYPLVNYRHMVGRPPWGGYVPGLFPHPYIIANLPLVIPAAALCLMWRTWRKTDENRGSLRIGIVLLIYSAFGLWSVYYLPDYLHFTYLAPVWFVLLGWVAESLLRAWPAVAPVRAVVALLLLGSCWQMLATLQQWRTRCRFPVDSAIGRLNTPNPDAGAVYQWFNDLFRSAGTTHIFAFPTSPDLYLITGMENATRYQIVLPSYTDREQLQEVVDDLERQKIEFVIRNYYLAPRQMEPLNTYLDQAYEKIPVPPPFKSTTIIGVYRRKAAADKPPPSQF